MGERGVGKAMKSFSHSSSFEARTGVRPAKKLSFFTVNFGPPPPTPRNLLKFALLDFGRTDFSRNFIFEPPDFYADFVARFFSAFLQEEVPRKRKIPGKILQKLAPQKAPTHFCRGAGPKVCLVATVFQDDGRGGLSLRGGG